MWHFCSCKGNKSQKWSKVCYSSTSVFLFIFITVKNCINYLNKINSFPTTHFDWLVLSCFCSQMATCAVIIKSASRENESVSFRWRRSCTLLAANTKPGTNSVSLSVWATFFFSPPQISSHSVSCWQLEDSLADNSMQSRHHSSMILPGLLCTHLPLNSNLIQIKSNSKLFQM